MTVRELIEGLWQEDEKGPGCFFLGYIVAKLRRLDGAMEIVPEFVPNLFQGVMEELQLHGMELSSGNADHDNSLWDQLTKTLALVRDVLIRESKVDLPEARVVSVVTEMMEDGLLEEIKGEDGETYVKPADPYKLKIRVVKIPAGPAPEQFRQFWVGMELPARQRNHRGRAAFGVPEEWALKLLQEKSPDAVKWFQENFPAFGDLLFGADEVQVVQ